MLIWRELKSPPGFFGFESARLHHVINACSVRN